jgi:uncharacterized protein (UPF0261 family)
MSIVIIGTLDTKGVEVGFIRDEIVKRGRKPLVIDTGVMGQPAIPANITREAVAEAGGEKLAGLVEKGDKAHAQQVMIKGVVKIVSDLHEQGKVDGVIAAGGAQGTSIATSAMQALPVGIPKVMVSTVACGQATFGPYVGTKDITMIHSVADILGINRVTRRILAQAAGAVVGMVGAEVTHEEEKELVAITQAGITTPGVMGVKDRLEKLGFEVIAFHCNGIGGEAMEELVANGEIKGVIDFSPHDITDLLYGGLMPAYEERMRPTGQAGIPQIVTPGCADIRLHGPKEEMPESLCERACVIHTPIHTHVRTTAEEMAAVGRFVAERLNNGSGPRAVMVPLKGYSLFNREGKVLYDEEANLGFARGVQAELNPDVEYIEVEAHINDPAFAEATVNTFLRLREAAGREPIEPQ